MPNDQRAEVSVRNRVAHVAARAILDTEVGKSFDARTVMALAGRFADALGIEEVPSTCMAEYHPWFRIKGIEA